MEEEKKQGNTPTQYKFTVYAIVETRDCVSSAVLDSRTMRIGLAATREDAAYLVSRTKRDKDLYQTGYAGSDAVYERRDAKLRPMRGCYADGRLVDNVITKAWFRAGGLTQTE